MKLPIACVLAGSLLLAGCGDDAPERSDDERTASGDVRGGTISDAMLPLDTVTSQSPPMRTAPAESGDDAGDEPETEGDATEADDAAQADVAPPAAPAPVQPAPAAPSE